MFAQGTDKFSPRLETGAERRSSSRSNWFGPPQGEGVAARSPRARRRRADFISVDGQVSLGRGDRRVPEQHLHGA